MNENQIAFFDFRKHTVNSKFVVVFAQTASYIIFMIARSIFFAHNGNVMVRTINSRTHQVSCASIKTDVFFVGVFFVDCSCNQCTVRSKHIATKFGEDFYIAHTSGNEDFFISLAYTFADSEDIVFRLFRFVSDTNTAGKVDEFNVSASFFFQFNCNFEKDACQFRIVVIGNSVGSKECVHTKMFNTFSKQFFISLSHLGTSQTVFSITRVIHNVVCNCKLTTRIVTAADGFRDISHLFQEINVSNIVQVNGYIQFASQLEIFCRSCVGREHDLAFFETNRVGHQKFGIGRAVCTATFFTQNFEQSRVRSSFYCEIFFEAFVPAKSLVYKTSSFADAFFVVEIEGSGILRRDIFKLFFSNERNFLSHWNHLSVFELT